jgi:hypothetical protein
MGFAEKRGCGRRSFPTLCVLIAASLLVASCAEGSTATNAPAEGPRIGTPVSLDGALITARFLLFSKGDYASFAEAGKTWVAVTVRIEDTGDTTLEINLADFSLLTSGGEVRPSEDVDRLFYQLLENTTLDPGSRVEGRIVFYAPEGELLKLQWKPSWSDQSVVISLVKQ